VLVGGQRRPARNLGRAGHVVALREALNLVRPEHPVCDRERRPRGPAHRPPVAERQPAQIAPIIAAKPKVVICA